MASRALDGPRELSSAGMTAATLDPRTLDHLRTRTVRTLLASVALGSTGHIAAITVATVVAADLTQTSAWSGVPAAAVVLGAAAGSTMLSRVVAKDPRAKTLRSASTTQKCVRLSPTSRPTVR